MITWVLIMWYGLGGSSGMMVIGHYPSFDACTEMVNRVQKTVPGYSHDIRTLYCIEDTK